MVTEQLSDLPSLWTRAVLCATIVNGCFNGILLLLLFLMWPMGAMAILSSTQPPLYIYLKIFTDAKFFGSELPKGLALGSLSMTFCWTFAA